MDVMSFHSLDRRQLLRIKTETMSILLLVNLNYHDYQTHAIRSVAKGRLWPSTLILELNLEGMLGLELYADTFYVCLIGKIILNNQISQTATSVLTKPNTHPKCQMIKQIR
jgi:hypothetical protein